VRERLGPDPAARAPSASDPAPPAPAGTLPAAALESAGANLRVPASIDLHTHSSASDGALTPAELVHQAAGAGIGLLALTDHDTTAGLDTAVRAAAAVGIELVPGVELSADWRAQSIHILGLWIDPAAPALSALLAQQAVRRYQRLRSMCERLTGLGLPGDACRRAVEEAPGMPTRMHLARALADAGCVQDPEEAFRRYLVPGRPACIEADWPALGSVVTTIVAAGGLAVLAHPARYRLSAGARRALLEAFRAAGGAGLEVVSGGQGGAHAEGLAALARHHGLKGSVGSDFHGPGRTWNPLGRLAKLPDRLAPVWSGVRPTTEQGRSAASLSS